MRSQGSELITWTVFNRMTFLRRSLMILLLSSRRKRMRLRRLSKISNRDTTELIRSSSKSISWIDSGLFSRMLVLMRTQDQWKQRKTISWNKSRNLRMKSFKSKSNGSLIRLNWLPSKPQTWQSLPIVMSSERKSLFSSKRSWDLILKFRVMRKKLDNLRLPRKILTLKWTSLMISTIKILTFNKNWRTITSISKMNSSRNLRNSKMRVSDLRITFLIWKSKKLTFLPRLLRLKDKFFSGRERFNLRRKCKMLLIQLLVRLRSLLWKRKSTEWSSDTNNFVRSKKKWSKIWSAQFSKERQFSSNTCQKLRKRMHKTNVSYI